MFNSAPQVFTTLTIGLLMAFAFQLLLTIFGTALGITAIAFQVNSSSNESDSDAKPSSSSLGSKIRTVGFAAGSGILVTINIVLFAACFLSVKLSLVVDPILGAILGVVIWSAYLLLLTWASSTAVSSLMGTVLGSVASGFRGVISAVSAALSHKDDEAQSSSAETSTIEVVRQEVRAALDAADVQQTVEAYLEQLQPPKLDLEAVRADLEQVLADPSLRSLPVQELSTINRETFANLLRDRTDLSKRDAKELIDQLETIWHQEVARQPQRDLNSELLRFLRSANPEELKFNQLTTKLEELLGTQKPNVQSAGLFNLQALDLKSLMKTLLRRIDLSDIDVEQIWEQLQSFNQQLNHQDNHSTEQSATAQFSTIKADIEDYLLNSYRWNLERKTVQLEFEDVLYDPEADPNQVQEQLEQLHRDNFVTLLNQRDDFSAAKIEKIANRLEEVRVEVLKKVQMTAQEQELETLQLRLEDYFCSAKKSSSKPKSIQRAAKAFLDEAQPKAVLQILKELDRKTLRQVLEKQGTLRQKQADQQLDGLEELRDRLSAEVQTLQEHAQSTAEERWKKLECYLRYTAVERLNPKNVKRKLQSLLEKTSLGSSSFESGFVFDRERLATLLQRRQGLTSNQIHQLLEQLEKTWTDVLHIPQKPYQEASEAYDRIADVLGDYLHKVDWADLNPADLKQSLMQLLHDPKAEAFALGLLTQISRKSVDNSLWKSLHERLQRRQDLTDVEIQRVIDRLQNVARQLLKAPRRWATRSQEQQQNFAARLRDYLLTNEKTNFNPDDIQHDLEQLLNDAQQEVEHEETASSEKLSSLLTNLDRSTLESCLIEREDLTESETQQIASDIESARDRILDAAKQSQSQVQQLLEESLTKLRHYLDSLKLPELGYDAIEDQFHQLLNLSQSQLNSWGDSLGMVLDKSLPGDAFFKEARDRLSRFSHDTLSTLIDARDDIPRTVANQLVTHIEGARDRLLTQVETLQQQAERQVDSLKQQAQRNAVATRKAAAAAAWWLFSITLTSGISAAIAGSLATRF